MRRKTESRRWLPRLVKLHGSSECVSPHSSQGGRLARLPLSWWPSPSSPREAVGKTRRQSHWSNPQCEHSDLNQDRGHWSPAPIFRAHDERIYKAETNQASEQRFEEFRHHSVRSLTVIIQRAVRIFKQANSAPKAFHVRSLRTSAPLGQHLKIPTPLDTSRVQGQPFVYPGMQIQVLRCLRWVGLG